MTMRGKRDIPAMRVWPKSISASCFNCVRLAQRRLGCPLRHELKAMGLILVLHQDTWAGMAPWDEELPLLAWMQFDSRRNGIDQPVSCRLYLYLYLYLYHAHAGLLMGTALDALECGLRTRLDALARPPSSVSQLAPPCALPSASVD